MMEDTPITPAVAAELPRIRFDLDMPGKELPFDWAEKGLCWLYQYRRQVFADMMLAVMDTGFQTGNARKNAVNGHRP